MIEVVSEEHSWQKHVTLRLRGAEPRRLKDKDADDPRRYRPEILSLSWKDAPRRDWWLCSVRLAGPRTDEIGRERGIGYIESWEDHEGGDPYGQMAEVPPFVLKLAEPHTPTELLL